MTDIIFYGQFITSKVGTNGLTVTVDIDRFTRSDGTRSALVTGASATAVTRRGLYYYRLTGADPTLYDYIATFITATATVDQQEVAALAALVNADIQSIETAVSEAISDAVWDEALAAHQNAGSTGEALDTAASCTQSIGSIEFTYTVLDTGSNPIDGVQVWISTDIAGADVVWSGVTDAFGIARDTANLQKPFLDPGTYYFWSQKSGYSFSNPDTEVVS